MLFTKPYLPTVTDGLEEHVTLQQPSTQQPPVMAEQGGFFKRFYLFMFREKGREEKEGEKHRCVTESLTESNWGPGPQPRPVP